MRRFAHNFALSDFARRDLFFCLGIWLAIALVSFVLLPALRLAQPGALITLWMAISAILGIGGAVLIALGTQFTAVVTAQDKPMRRSTRIFISLLSWLGLFGIAFPLVYMSLQIFGKVFALIKN
jgi:hypothetical protein